MHVWTNEEIWEKKVFLAEEILKTKTPTEQNTRNVQASRTKLCDLETDINVI
jgi:hypothetical protein